MNKTNKILIGIALTQLIAIVGMTFIGDSSEAATYEPTSLIEWSADEVTSITIDDDESNSITLQKSGENWLVASSDDYPADTSRILKGAGVAQGSPVLDKLTSLKVDRPTIRQPENHAPLKVAADVFERRVTLENSKGTKAVYYVASGARPQTVHVRRDGEDNVFEISDLSTWDLSTSLSNWIDTAYQTVEKSDVVSVAAEFADGKSFRIVRRESEAPEKGNETNAEDTPETDPIEYKWWFTVPTSDEVVQTEVDSLLAKLTALRLKDVHGKSAPEGADAPDATWTLTMADGKKVVLTVGAKTSDSSDDRHAKSTASEFHAIIASWDASSLLEVDLEKLRVKPADSEPAPETPKKK